MAQSNEAGGIYEERSALYYPYIHIRSENWLKSALLAFQKVSRIVPNSYELSDEDVIQPYSALAGPDGTPLLSKANSQTNRVERAQAALFSKLKEHEAALVFKYAHDRTPEEFRIGEKAFQIHRMKILDYEFPEWLVEMKLAWNTRTFENHDVYSWLTMQPDYAPLMMAELLYDEHRAEREAKEEKRSGVRLMHSMQEPPAGAETPAGGNGD